MKKRNKKFLKEKEYIRLKKQLCLNNEAQRNLGWVELQKPEFIGYKAKLEPRQDIQNRDDNWVFLAICENFGTTCSARKISDFDWNKKKGSKYEPIAKPHIRSINQSTYLILPPQVQKYFKEDPYYNRFGIYYYCIVPDFYWEIKYDKNYRTKAKIFDEILQQEESELKYTINTKFYDFDNRYRYAPKSFRKILNREQRAKSKQTLYRIQFVDNELEFEDNYRDAAWWYW